MLKVYITNPDKFGKVRLIVNTYLNGNLFHSDETIGNSIKGAINKRFPYEKFGKVRFVVTREPGPSHSVYFSVDCV